jgi:hypothetical protein
MASAVMATCVIGAVIGVHWQRIGAPRQAEVSNRSLGT